MTRMRELIEKAATAPLTEDERQELQRHFVGLAQREAHIILIIRAEEAEEIADDNRFLRACGVRPPDMQMAISAAEVRCFDFERME
jgi:hypothetical protein